MLWPIWKIKNVLCFTQCITHIYFAIKCGHAVEIYIRAHYQWRIYIGNPPGGPNSFNFMQFLGKFGKIVFWGPLESWRPLLGKILDPPLNTVNVQHILRFQYTLL